MSENVEIQLIEINVCLKNVETAPQSKIMEDYIG